MKKNNRLVKIFCSYFSQFITRCVIFLICLALYIAARVKGVDDPFLKAPGNMIFWGIIWVIFMAEMLFRFLPTNILGIGCKKLFRRLFKPTEKTKPHMSTSPWRVLLLAVIWIIANGLIGALYLLHIIDAGMLVLLSLLYSIGDLVCVLFFCPFRDWFLKNRCCADCVIYNWDYPMMFTPLIFIPHPYTWSLAGVSLILLVLWETAKVVHPERFAENTNAAISCKYCKHKPCKHAKRLAKRYRRKA